MQNRAVPRIAIATCRDLPGGDPDDAPLLPELAALGVDAHWAVWDDPAVDWAAVDAVLLRSTWDYAPRRDAFLSWLATLPAAINPAPLVAWNTDKRYLRDLAAAGLPVIPTRFLAPGEPLTAVSGAVVVKPSVSAGSKDTARFAPGDADGAGALVASIHASGRTAMVQPHLSAVDTAGETAVVLIDGVVSHAVRKGPILREGAPPAAGLHAPEEISPRRADGAETDLAVRVVDLVRSRGEVPAYARVDLIPGPDGAPLILEVELAEPSLFLAHAPGAVARLAAAVARRVGAPG